MAKRELLQGCNMLISRHKHPFLNRDGKTTYSTIIIGCYPGGLPYVADDGNELEEYVIKEESKSKLPKETGIYDMKVSIYSWYEYDSDTGYSDEWIEVEIMETQKVSLRNLLAKRSHYHLE